MTPNFFIQFCLFISSTLTFLANGILMIKEKDVLNFQKLNKNEDIYVGLLIYTEIYLGIILLYNLLFYIYEQFYNCCNDNKISTSFSFLKTLYILSGLFSHLILVYYLIKHKNYIDENINKINTIFTSNIAFCFFIVCVVNIYKKCSKNKTKE